MNQFCPFKRQPYKMVKHTQTQFVGFLPNVFDHFIGLALKGLYSEKKNVIHNVKFLRKVLSLFLVKLLEPISGEFFFSIPVENIFQVLKNLK